MPKVAISVTRDLPFDLTTAAEVVIRSDGALTPNWWCKTCQASWHHHGIVESVRHFFSPVFSSLYACICTAS